MWQKLGPIAVGGPVFGMAINQDRQTWLVTGAGILEKSEAGWTPISQSRPLTLMNGLCAAGNKWWTAGLAGGLIRSWDNGQSWQYCWIDQITEPITCFAVSPRYETDYTLLAGTNGAGVLRSNDGGRRWLLSNFGLQDFTILALTPAGDWTGREYIFAGTLNGVYRSSGGGRAWKLSGLADMAVQALAASANFADNGLVIAGTEAYGLYRSTDGGREWQQVEGDFPEDFTINALLSQVDDASGQEYWLAGTDDGSLWRSADAGQSWAKVYAGADPVLILAGSHDFLLAGFSEQGIMISTDAGKNWQLDPTLRGYGFQRLRRGSQGRLFGIAPNDGVWSSTDRGQSWQRVLQASLAQPLFDFALTGENQRWLAAWAGGVWQQVEQADWQPTLPSPEGQQLVALAANDQAGSPAWAATLDCRLWRSDDEGATWEPVRGLFTGQQFIALAMSPADSTLILASFAPQRNELTLWRLQAEQDGKESWEEWLSRPAPDSAYIRLAVEGCRAEQSMLIINDHLWSCEAGSWQKTGSFDSTIRQLAFHPDSQAVYLLVGTDILTKTGDGWQPLEQPDDLDELVDIQAGPGGDLFGLDVTGTIWRYNLS